MRSMLFVPGGDERKLAKALDLEVPAFILDLEDSVTPERKAEARSLVAGTLPRLRGASWVRVNPGPPEILYDDLHAVVEEGLSGLVLPKVEDPAAVQRVDWLLSALEPRAGLRPGSVGLLATIETARGLGAVDAIARASDRVSRLGFGAGDFSLDVGLDWSAKDGGVSDLLVLAKCRIVLASRQAGLNPPHDSVFPSYRDGEGLRREAAAARSLGFGGKHAIHPDQIPIIEEVFSPTREEIEEAYGVIARFEEAAAGGTGNVGREGRMVDQPVVERARRVIASLAATADPRDGGGAGRSQG